MFVKLRKPTERRGWGLILLLTVSNRALLKPFHERPTQSLKHGVEPPKRDEKWNLEVLNR